MGKLPDVAGTTIRSWKKEELIPMKEKSEKIVQSLNN